LIVVPAGGIELRQNVLSTGVGFSDHASIAINRARWLARDSTRSGGGLPRPRAIVLMCTGLGGEMTGS
jgi:hypothetical protein